MLDSGFLQTGRIGIKSVFSALCIVAAISCKYSFGVRVTLPIPVLGSLLSGLEPDFSPAVNSGDLADGAVCTSRVRLSKCANWLQVTSKLCRFPTLIRTKLEAIIKAGSMRELWRSHSAFLLYLQHNYIIWRQGTVQWQIVPFLFIMEK